MGKVSVLSLVAPASISTAPNSPMALDQVITEPAKIPPLDMGRLTLRKARIGLEPNVWATYS